MTLGDEEGLHGPVGGEEGLHVDDEILLQRQALDCLHGDVTRAEILDERLAREPIAAVDAHGIGAADAMPAGTSERQCAVLLALDLHERVEHAVGGVRRDDELLPVRLLVDLGDEAPDLEGDVARFDALGSLGGLEGGSHQYLRSIGW